MPRWPSDWLGLSPEASHTARVAGSHLTNGFVFSNTVELTLELTKMRIREATQCADARDAGSVRQPRRFLWLRYMRAHQARDQRVSAVVRVSGMCLSIRRDTARSGRVARA
ncbi:hypothetical protein BRO03_23085 [Xanthomonas oryzae pv. oryzae]|nr:hypothetical protein BRO09_14850 [Xanthomonas oryzae pv. oryzae]RBB08983.1 hypothetical protein BRO12_15375 [Xanthomonas oryzae pv. oryzae]RBB10284.1 hypothetical protein BRN97_17610 [Xanthomonas oryzae pv. oryzae]RBB17036.1 hypothetical protein BRO13_18320 [Xanthomonas oryzae pv. oryzae]RBB23226.1 hypothetical protein BRO04_17990 [Xanthomonas oryzae pv. oryzae]